MEPGSTPSAGSSSPRRLQLTSPEFRQRIRAALEVAFQDRFRAVILYGSEARGEATIESDVDLLLLLEGPVDLVHDLDTGIRAIYRLQLELEYPIHLTPVEEDVFEQGEYALYRNAQRDGVRL